MRKHQALGTSLKSLPQIPAQPQGQKRELVVRDAPPREKTAESQEGDVCAAPAGHPPPRPGGSPNQGLFL